MMAGHKMTAAQRIEAAITITAPDRIPICPQLDYMTARMAGKTCAEYVSSIGTANECMKIAYKEFGGWDWLYNPTGSYLFIKTFFMDVKVPGLDLPEHTSHQIVERILSQPEDYDYVIKHGYKAYKKMIMERLGKQIDVALLPGTMEKIRTLNQEWESRGIPIQKAGTHFIPFEIFCLHRTFNEFVTDMYRTPEKILEASHAMLPEILDEIRGTCKLLDNKAFWLGVWRASASFISPKQFEKFVHPFIKEIVMTLIGEGLRPIFHLDGNMAPMLEYFTEYPKGTCIMALDGYTDMRKAKQVVGDRMCIMGDVPPTLLCLGTEAEVERYCRDLIDDMGPGGGFILGSGCTVPVNAKVENVKTMIDTGKAYGRY